MFIDDELKYSSQEEDHITISKPHAASSLSLKSYIPIELYPEAGETWAGTWPIDAELATSSSDFDFIKYYNLITTVE